MQTTIITAHMPDGTERVFIGREQARKELGISTNYFSLMLKTGCAYCATAHNARKDLVGMTLTGVTATIRKASEQHKKAAPFCLRCTHLYPFDAKEGTRYVCCLYGKRIEEEPENCKGFEAGANKRQMEG